MNNISKIRGLRFPDPYIIKFFYKESLFNFKGNIIEFGCGNGNNLFLFYAYGYNVCGIDKDKISIENAIYNLKTIFNETTKACFINYDLVYLDKLIKENTELTNNKFDIFSFPNVVNYIRKKDFEDVLKSLKNILKKNGKFFIRFRSPRDMRVALGKKIGNGEYFIESDITGEANTILSVYEESEIINILSKYFKLYNLAIFHIFEENLHKDRKIFNSDIVIWGDFKI